MRKILQYLWLLPEDKPKKPTFTIPVNETVARFPWFNRKEEIEDVFEETPIHEKKFMDKLEKQRRVSKMNESIGSFDMLVWYDRLKGKQELRKLELTIPVHPKKVFQWDVSKVVERVEAERMLAAGKRYIANVDEVLNHK